MTTEQITIPVDRRERAEGLGILGGAVLLAGGLLGNFVFGASAIVLPAIEKDLRIGTAVGSLFVALFSLGFAVALVFGGRLGDRYGRRRIFIIGLAAFALSSIAVALAPAVLVLLVARILQGIMVGLLFPQVLATIQHHSTGAARARWLAAYAAVIGGGTTLGQILGGALVSVDWGGTGWRQVFVLVALLCAVVAGLCGAVPKTRSEHPVGTDVPGALLFGAGIAAVLLPLALGPQSGWPWWSYAAIAAAVLLLAAFAVLQRRGDPARVLMPPAALREPELVLGLTLAVLFFAGYGAFVYYFSVSFEEGLGMSAFSVALSLAPFAIGFIAASLVVPRIAGRFGPVRTMLAGAIAQAVLLGLIALLVFALWPHPWQWMLQPALILMGVAQAFMYGPLIGTVMGAMPRHLAGLASGLFATAQQVAIALGVAAFGALYGAFALHGPAGFVCCAVLQAAVALVFAAVLPRLRKVAR
ncbi:MFS transporter [Humibacter albus]|uniref:MFS transporter n=1 Tax=Humibacter albus TaxID=427754 RepID=UPI0003B745F0|nr:MFS transporter [Humibacter albus]